MSVRWTEEQKKVIDVRNKNVLVSAAAGSGKTAVLVERILSLVCGEGEDEKPLDVDRLLVVTFTKAAAAEMRERVGLALEKRLEEEPEEKGTMTPFQAFSSFYEAVRHCPMTEEQETILARMVEEAEEEERV